METRNRPDLLGFTKILEKMEVREVDWDTEWFVKEVSEEALANRQWTAQHAAGWWPGKGKRWFVTGNEGRIQGWVELPQKTDGALLLMEGTKDGEVPLWLASSEVMTEKSTEQDKHARTLLPLQKGAIPKLPLIKPEYVAPHVGEVQMIGMALIVWRLYALWGKRGKPVGWSWVPKWEGEDVSKTREASHVAWINFGIGSDLQAFNSFEEAVRRANYLAAEI